jgi:hypothetical protein
MASLEIGQDFGLGSREKRAEEVGRRDHGHPLDPGRAGPAEQVGEERLDLVVTVVTQGHQPVAVPRADLFEERKPEVAGPGRHPAAFDPGRLLGRKLQKSERQSVRLGQGSYEERILVGILRAQSVVDVGDAQLQVEPAAQSSEEIEKSDRIGPSRHGDEDRPVRVIAKLPSDLALDNRQQIHDRSRSSPTTGAGAAPQSPSSNGAKLRSTGRFAPWS